MTALDAVVATQWIQFSCIEKFTSPEWYSRRWAFRSSLRYDEEPRTHPQRGVDLIVPSVYVGPYVIFIQTIAVYNVNVLNRPILLVRFHHANIFDDLQSLANTPENGVFTWKRSRYISRSGVLIARMN